MIIMRHYYLYSVFGMLNLPTSIARKWSVLVECTWRDFVCWIFRMWHHIQIRPKFGQVSKNTQKKPKDLRNYLQPNHIWRPSFQPCTYDILYARTVYCIHCNISHGSYCPMVKTSHVCMKLNGMGHKLGTDKERNFIAINIVRGQLDIAR